MTDPFWQIPVPQLLTGLQTTGDGLTTPAVAVLRQKFGTNEAAAPKRTPAWLRIGKRFANPLVMILLVARTLSAVSGDLASFIIVTAIVTVSVLLDYTKRPNCRKSQHLGRLVLISDQRQSDPDQRTQP